MQQHHKHSTRTTLTKPTLQCSSSTTRKQVCCDTKHQQPFCCVCMYCACVFVCDIRFVESLLLAGRPATALAVQRARCAGSCSSGGGSSSGGLKEAQVLLRVQLGCGLLPEAFCDVRRHCEQVRFISQTATCSGFPLPCLCCIMWVAHVHHVGGLHLSYLGHHAAAPGHLIRWHCIDVSSGGTALIFDQVALH